MCVPVYQLRVINMQCCKQLKSDKDYCLQEHNSMEGSGRI